MLARAILRDDRVAAAGRLPQGSPQANVQAQQAGLIRAPLQKTGLLVRGEAVKGATEQELIDLGTVWSDMKVARFKPEKIIAAGPEDKPGRIDDSRFAGIVRADQNVQTTPKLE